MNAGRAAGIVIVGGGPAGLSAARAYREHGGDLPVTIVTAEADAPYERPPLTKEYLRGEVERTELDLEQPDWYVQQRVELRTNATATRLDTAERVVELADGERLSYESCVLATGSEPGRPPVPGADAAEVATVRAVADSERLRGHGARAVVVGTGFIGCEAAASLALRGARVTVVGEEEPQATRLGEEVARRLRGWLEDGGVKTLVGAGIEAIERADDGSLLRVLVGGEAVEADTVLLATGVAPRLALAEAAGLELAGGAVRAGERMHTSAPGVLVAGDVAFAHNAAAERPLRVEHWGEALTHGAIAGATLAGVEERWCNAPGFWSTIGDRTLKYVAWGDGHESVRLDGGSDGAFTAWYADGDGICVGVLTHDRDEDYERGRELVEQGRPVP